MHKRHAITFQLVRDCLVVDNVCKMKNGYTSSIRNACCLMFMVDRNGDVLSNEVIDNALYYLVERHSSVQDIEVQTEQSAFCVLLLYLK